MKQGQWLFSISKWRFDFTWKDLQAPGLSQFGADELDDDTETGDAFENGRIFDDHLQEGQRLKSDKNISILNT